MSTNTPIQAAAVEVDISTLKMSSHGSITGVVTIRVDSFWFPEARWSDFPVVILGWWLEPTSPVLGDNSRSWELHFMDGPFLIRFQKNEGDIWQISGLRRSGVGPNEAVELTAFVSRREFIQSLLAAAREILAACHRHGWQGRDIDTLTSGVERLERIS